MHYENLITAHKAFYRGEYRAENYDEYLKDKNWALWQNSVPMSEVEKLFNFIRSWDFHFKGDEEKFKEIYEEIAPFLKNVEHLKIENVDLANDELKKNISIVFDRVADCTLTGRCESTDASKILHTIVPDFFVMWDHNIRLGTLGDAEDKQGLVYAYRFLPLVQRELAEAIETCIKERALNRDEAIKYICEKCDGKTLAKLVDEYNYVKYTLKLDRLQLADTRDKAREEWVGFVELLNKLHGEGKITAEIWRDLAAQWRNTPEKREWLLQHLKELQGKTT